MKWLKDKLRLKVSPTEIVVIMPVYLDRILIKCPECDAGGIWPTPEGFRIAIMPRLLVNCPNGHNWAISGVWAEDKSEEEANHDD